MMQYRKVYWTVALFTFFIGLTASATWLVLKRSKLPAAHPKIAATNQPNSLCEFLSNPKGELVSEEVQVRGILVGFHEVTLYDPSCDGSANAVVTNLTSSARNKLISSVERLSGSAFQRGNFWVMVILRGRFEPLERKGIGDPAKGLATTSLRVSNHYSLVVLDIENVDYVSPNISWPE